MKILPVALYGICVISLATFLIVPNLNFTEPVKDLDPLQGEHAIQIIIGLPEKIISWSLLAYAGLGALIFKARLKFTNHGLALAQTILVIESVSIGFGFVSLLKYADELALGTFCWPDDRLFSLLQWQFSWFLLGLILLGYLYVHFLRMSSES